MSKETISKSSGSDSDDIIAKIDAAIEQVEEGKVISHSEVGQIITEWTASSSTVLTNEPINK